METTPWLMMAIALLEAARGSGGAEQMQARPCWSLFLLRHPRGWLGPGAGRARDSDADTWSWARCICLLSFGNAWWGRCGRGLPRSVL